MAMIAILSTDSSTGNKTQIGNTEHFAHGSKKKLMAC